MMRSTFDPTEHPRDRFGRFRDKLGDASTQVVDALMQWDERLAGDAALQKRMYDNYRGILKDNLLTEGKAVEDTREAGRANAENERFQQAQERFGAADSVVVIKPGADGFASGAMAERRGGTSFVQDYSADDLEWPETPVGEITPGGTNATNDLAGALRHEYGHSVWNTLGGSEQNSFREALPDDWKVTRDNLSQYGGYAQRMGKPNEPFCELFSVVTHEDYDREALHPDLQPVAEIMERLIFGGTQPAITWNGTERFEKREEASEARGDAEFLRFDSVESADEWATDAYAPWVDSLTPEEREAVRAYKVSSYEFNQPLRFQAEMGEEIPHLVTPETREKMTQLDSALEKAQAPEDMVVYRGMPRPSQDEFTEVGYSSTSLAREQGVMFQEIAGGDSVLAEIRVPEGAHAAYIETFNNLLQAEVLLPRDTTFRQVESHDDETPPRIVLEIVEDQGEGP